MDGCPYFSIYDLTPFIEGFGGVGGTREAIERFRQKVKNAGFRALHLNVIVWSVKILPDEQTISSPNELVNALGFDSIASYVWIHHVGMPQFPVTPFENVAAQAYAHWRSARDEFDLPYHPNVTMGWDASPRTIQSDMWEEAVYPYMAAIGQNTPAAFKIALQEVKKFLDERPDGPRAFSINAWNEWTEGSYLEPDTKNKFGYLEAIRDIFGTR